MKPEKKNNLFCRFYLDSNDMDHANSVAKKAAHLLGEFGAAEIVNIERYWKFDNSYEIIIEMTAENPTREKINEIKSIFPGDSIDENEGFIWTKSEDQILFDNSVFWCMVGIAIEQDL